ncbi:cytochrome c peroxidase [Maribacter vaceletii]|uniref:Cytochrome c peroxidase n=1 Tax=Maribacter vaceletii TaxID=1206816 RepID=A0A495E691_9FLAO|nr:cytochrome c peroxidase [Maribacter vaceletii]RKR12454.1 cytochrome c peroxidase [Maribacter vaceletii]
MSSYQKTFSFFFLLFVFWSCRDKVSERIISPNKEIDTIVFAALPRTVKSPINNKNTKDKVALGKLLFYDPILSGSKDIACVTCHHPSTGYAEFLDVSIGTNAKGFGSKRVFNSPNTIPFVKRNAHTVLNTAFNGLGQDLEYDPENAPMFWDLRANSLEEQALMPIKTLEEMRGSKFTEETILPEVVKRLKQIPEYKKLFKNAFSEENAISEENLGKAIAAFERTLVATNSRFDQYMREDENAILLSEKEGFSLFKQVGCANCHNGPMFSDYKEHVLGVPENIKIKEIDSGVNRSYAFRTPTLRNLRFTAPYMHNGSFLSLQKVLEFYEDISNNKTINKNVSPKNYDPFIKQLNLSVKEMSLIISFLNTLNDTDFDKEIPEKVPSGLPVGGNIK